jgi:adenylosuccinate lyase
MAGVWSDESKLARWLDVELAALEAWAELGAVPTDAVAEIRERATAPTPERVAELEGETQHDVAAFVDAVAAELGPNGRWVHHGLTSSDVVDTGLSLQVRDAGELVLSGLERGLAAVLTRAREHKDDVCIGRTHGIHAEPTTFGLKLTGWAFELDRARRRLAAALETMRVGKLSGAVGTYAATDPELERIACERLGLEPDPVSTQIVQRDRHAELLAALALVAASRGSRSRSAISRARRSARWPSRSAKARRARPRCRTSATRWSRSGCAAWPASCGPTRSWAWRTSRSGTSATSRTPPPSGS